MKFSKRSLFSKRAILAVAGVAAGAAIGLTFSGKAKAQAPSVTCAAGTNAGQCFKNVQTDALKALTPGDFLSAMGVMTDSLGLDCADCHPGAGTDKVDWVFDTPQKVMARRMVNMMQAINKEFFNGTQQVTCYVCHHAREKPSTTVSLDNLYSTPNFDKDDIITADKTAPAATEILDRYVAALGGQQKLNTLTSYIMTGESIGYEGLGGNGQLTIYAKAPNMRTTEIKFPTHPDRAPSIWTYDGKAAWMTAPRGLLGEYQLDGANAEGAAFEATSSFPGSIKGLFPNWVSGGLESIGENASPSSASLNLVPPDDYRIVEGTARGGNLRAKFYFDQKTNLLVRVLRMVNSPVGRIPIQVDFADYRDVNGIKFPFKMAFLWLDGRWNAEIKDVKINAAIDNKIFAKP